MSEPPSRYQRKLIDLVQRHGWQCTMVGDAEGVEPPFAYTVGLWESLGAPELIVFGLDLDLMHGMLAALVRQLEAGAAVRDGARWTDLLDSADCVTRAVQGSRIRREWFASALWYRRHRAGDERLEAFQLVWPGAYQKLFPWEAGCVREVIDAQPPLWAPAAEDEQ